MGLNQYNEVVTIRKKLGLSQAQFGQLFDVHAMTVSKWERGILNPSAYQQSLMDKFDEASNSEQIDIGNQILKLLVSAGAIAALIYLLKNSK